jgi:hypothetical protein
LPKISKYCVLCRSFALEGAKELGRVILRGRAAVHHRMHSLVPRLDMASDILDTRIHYARTSLGLE